jgi:FkbM family methyltransferase
MKPSLINGLNNHVSLKLPGEFTGTFTYVDCGARGDTSNSLLMAFSKSRYIGFDPGFTGSPGKGGGDHFYFPVALGKRSETLDFHRTGNPNCSSIFIPNQEFLNRFVEIGPFFKIEETLPINLVALDEFLPQNGIEDVDFIELDTQGSELDILNGARRFLSTGILGARVEVEFSEMYRGQPFFADVDDHLRHQGFMLFDLERYHVRRKSCPPDVPSREQIVWGQALYLRDFHTLALHGGQGTQKIAKLAIIASFYGFHSYALEIMMHLLENEQALSNQEMDELRRAYSEYVNSLKKGNPFKLMFRLVRSPLSGIFQRIGSFILQWGEAYLFVFRKQKYFWKD